MTTMITVEEKQALETKINDLKTKINLLQEELLVNERTLWWLKRPHILEFECGYDHEYNDDGGFSDYFQAYGVILNYKWIEDNGIKWQIFCDHLGIPLCPADADEIADCSGEYLRDINNPDNYDIDYPDFVEHAEETMRNPNYAKTV